MDQQSGLQGLNMQCPHDPYCSTLATYAHIIPELANTLINTLAPVGVQKIRGPFLRVLIRILVYCGLFWGPLFCERPCEEGP